MTAEIIRCAVAAVIGFPIGVLSVLWYRKARSR